MTDGTALTADPFDSFAAWLAAAKSAELNDPNAMTLATATPDGRPSARIVLLKGADRAGFVFYTNTLSRKGRELADNQAVALLFHWKTLGRQVRVEGRASPVEPAEADAYYATRARLSRLGAWASDQSQPLASRSVLEARLEAAEKRFPDRHTPRPPHWSGYRVRPDEFEFWQDMPFRLHDRTIFTRDGDSWVTAKLFP